ncbi:hypothetical protein NHX12_013677 [Muraenolepis orangiensis]|uniref:Uncharacterized protein n=1 Tax=Muraenolepis orangiensis TaxID=630683 RepID=A0A9Q0DAM6_9TELE|nr:hypothetical protein NHX12_013677 [Muraenolepis orangiensis]
MIAVMLRNGDAKRMSSMSAQPINPTQDTSLLLSSQPQPFPATPGSKAYNTSFAFALALTVKPSRQCLGMAAVSGVSLAGTPRIFNARGF